MTKTLQLYQPLNGYCYNSDTHFLYHFITANLKQFKNIQGNLLDIGSGSGVLGLLVARDYKKLQLNQIEIQKDFQFLSQKNSEVNGISNHLFKGDFLKYNFKEENISFDYIISNPPFYNNDVIKSENESLKIARYNDNIPLDKFIQKASSLLTQKGKFFFCYDSKQIANIIQELQNAKLNIEAISFLHPNSKKEASLVLVYARKNSKSKLKIIPPYIMFDDNGEFSTLTQDIYKLCSTHSIKVEL